MLYIKQINLVALLVFLIQIKNSYLYNIKSNHTLSHMKQVDLSLWFFNIQRRFSFRQKIELNLRYLDVLVILNHLRLNLKKCELFIQNFTFF